MLLREPADWEMDTWLTELDLRNRADIVARFLTAEEYPALRCRQEGECP